LFFQLKVNTMKKLDINEVRDFIQAQSLETKVYIGGDSTRFRKNGVWHAEYTMAIVVHIDGKHGCKIFGESSIEVDYDQKRSRPAMRLMNEVYKISELYLKLHEVLEDREVSVHLDINPNEMYGSSCVVQQAIGYIRGVCNVIPMVKPNAWAASYAADRLKEVIAA
jgi:predicted RNase H-related nuclease YkuK (DUF458 family)